MPTSKVINSSDIQSQNIVPPLAPNYIKELASAIPKLSVIKSSPLATIPKIHSYSNATKTPDGVYAIPFRTVDEHGMPLTIHYEKSSPVLRVDKLPLSIIRGPTPGLYQEGVIWQYVSVSSRVGLSEHWTLPSFQSTGSDVGIYFNPVNMFYPVAAPNYNFFQIDYGVAAGDSGVTTGWLYTYASIGGAGGDVYNVVSMPAVPVIPGGTYIVDAFLVPSPLVPTPVYEVQITHNGKSWIYVQPLGYQPLPGNIVGLSSYQDQYIDSSSGTITITPDANAKPGLIKDVGNSLVIDRTLVTGLFPFDELNPALGLTTWDILSPQIINFTAFSNYAASSSWPLSCSPPDSGDWIITADCMLSSTANAMGNVIVQANSLLKIPASTSLSVNFTQYDLLVKSGSGVIVKSGARLSSPGVVTIALDSGASPNCASSSTCYIPSIEVTSKMHTIKWINRDSVAHTITSGKPSDSFSGAIFDSGLVAAGSAYSLTFPDSGTYNYFCTVHPWMTGQIIVR